MTKFTLSAAIAGAIIASTAAMHIGRSALASAEAPVNVSVSEASGHKAVSLAVSDLRMTVSNDAVERDAPTDLGRVTSEERSAVRSLNKFVADRQNMGSAGEPLTGTSFSFDGLSNFDNAAVFGMVIAPPDMVGEAGPDHYVQVVNSLFRVFDRSGVPMTPPLRLSSLFANLGTVCSSRNDGLPNILYDQLADRWIISQTCAAFPPFRQMIAVSMTGDPTGQWYAYEFVMPNMRLNDYPRMSVWPDGYYMTTNEFFGSDYTGSGIFAFDRRKMLEGDPNAGYVYLAQPAHIPFPGGMLPADLDGFRLPPEGSAAIIASHNADEYGHPNDAIRLFDFHPNFDQPSLTTLTERPESPIIVAPFDPTSPNGRADISQPPPGEKLDSVSDTLMSRLAYRNFGTHQSLVANQTVRTSGEPYRAGVRVYELQNTGSGFHPVVDATIGDASSSRWIGSAAQDNQGNLAVQYNFVSDEKRIKILYSGRLADDPPNNFRPEASLIDGTGVQKLFGWRWGEYSGMSVDPTDDCTFWITNAHYTLESEQVSDLHWLTRIGRFKFDECTPAPSASVSGNVTNSATGQPIPNAQLSVGAFSRRSSTTGSYGPFRLLPGSYEMTASKFGFRTVTSIVSLTNGQDLTRNIQLEPVAAIQFSRGALTGESCALDGSVDPGETVTINIALQNTGAANVSNLSARLLSSGGVTSPGPTHNYGVMPSGGPMISRPFTFTADPKHDCGTPITAVFELMDGTQPLQTISVQIPTGKDRVVLSQNFDRGLPAHLPPRWSRSATGSDGLPDAERNWLRSGKRSTSPTASFFSPAPHPMGVNELVSPVFSISTADARLTFQNWYELETTFLRNRLYDGSVLEIRIGGGEWQDIIAAGGQFESGGYDGIIDSCCQNPLRGRAGWSGWSGINRPAEFITSSVKLPPAAAGQRVQFRWRVGTDIGTFREGQYLDDIRVTDGFTCACQR